METIFNKGDVVCFGERKGRIVKPIIPDVLEPGDTISYAVNWEDSEQPDIIEESKLRKACE